MKRLSRVTRKRRRQKLSNDRNNWKGPRSTLMRRSHFLRISSQLDISEIQTTADSIKISMRMKIRHAITSARPSKLEFSRHARAFPSLGAKYRTLAFSTSNDTHRNPIRQDLNYNESEALTDAHVKRYKFRTEDDIAATQSSIDWRIPKCNIACERPRSVQLLPDVFIDKRNCGKSETDHCL